MSALPEALEIIFEVQCKRSNEKNNKTKNKLYNFRNAFFPPLFGALLFSNLISFLFISIDLKCYRNIT